ncbi:MAG: hypothetical protein ACRDZO_17690 [Egibacteraceae bacterium]
MRYTIKSCMAGALLAVMLMTAACGGDDGTSVRQIDEGAGGSTSASAPGSASGSASASGTAAPAIDPATADTTVPVTLAEWTITPESGAATEAATEAAAVEVAAGVIAFEATNGGSVAHELYIALGDSAETLPTTPEGAVDEAQLPEGTFIGEIEGFDPSTTMTAAFEMAPGTYVLFCNINDDTGVHFAEGMHTTLTVT